MSPSASGVIGGPEGGKAPQTSEMPATATIVSARGACCFQIQARDELADVGTEDVQAEVTQFVGNATAETDAQVNSDPEVLTDIYTPSFELGNFLKRPVRVAQYSIPQGEATNNFRVIQPWFSFFNDTAIKKKLDNYAYMRCKLHVEIVINSTPFIYGAYMASYQPMINFSGHQQYNTGLLSTDARVRVPMSQRQNVMIKSHTNEGGVLELPFLWHQNMIAITSAQDLKDLGEITLFPMAPFAAANSGATGNVGVTVYAWASDVQLAGQTTTLALQSDEYSAGPISRPASIVAGIGRRLSDVPVIGKFATAVSWGASAVSKIASLFGFTNVPVIENSMPFKNVPFHGFASAQIAGPIEKLTIDPKNELTVDPSIVGEPSTDELVIATMVQKPSFLRAITWQQSDLSDALLFTANVSPTICQTGVTSGGYSWYCDTPMGNVGRLFSNWRGDIEVIMKVVASSYHTGRLRVSFDPLGNLPTSTSSTTIQTKIVDIGETDEFVFRIPYMQPTAWKLLQSSVTPDFADRAAVTGYDTDVHNGLFTVSVLNALTAPVTTANVTLLFFLRGTDTVEFANPSDVPYFASTLEPQSKEIALGDTTPAPQERYLLNFGEEIRSVRTLMRRHALLQRVNFWSTAGTAAHVDMVWQNFGLYPPEYGYNPSGSGYLAGRNQTKGVITPANTYDVNFACTTPYTWMSTCFVGQRGSMMYAANWLGDETPSWKAYRWNYPRTSVSGQGQYDRSTAGNQVAWGAWRNVSGNTGMSLVNQKTQTGLEFLVPFMNKFAFVSTNPKYRVVGATFDDSANNTFTIETTRWFNNAAEKSTGALDLYGCVGPDFMPVHFLSVPVRFTYSMPQPVA